MDKIKNQTEYSMFKNINGNFLKLHIQEVSQCLKIRVINCGPTIYQRCIIIFITASVDMVLLFLGFVPINIICAILCFVLILTYTVCNMTTEGENRVYGFVGELNNTFKDCNSYTLLIFFSQFLENIVIIKDIGIEIARIRVCGIEKVFFPREQVQTVFINEVIYRNKVLFVMTLLVNDVKENKLVPCFTEILPQLALLKIVFNYIKKTL